MNKVEVYICGKKFVLNSSESPDYIKTLARAVDQKFTEAFAVDSALSLFDASVLVSIELVDELNRSDKNLNHIRCQIKRYAEEAESFRAELLKCQKLAEELKEQNQKLQHEIDMLSLKDEVDRTVNSEIEEDEKNDSELFENKDNF